MLRIIMILFVAFISLCIGLFSYYNASHYGYGFLWVIPVFYSLNIFFFYVILRQKNNIFTYILNILLFVRYVVLTFLLSYTNIDAARSSFAPFPSSYNLGVSLMVIEMIAIFTVTYFLISRIQLKFKNINFLSTSDTRIYLIFILLSLIAFSIQPSIWESVNFIIPSEKTLDDGESNFLGSITFFMLNLSRYLLIAVISSKLYSKYKEYGGKIKYMIVNYILAIFLCCFILGHNRADFLIPFIAVLVLLTILYKKRGAVVSLLSTLLAPIIISFITASRENLSASNDLPLLESWGITLQSYLGGIYNIAVAIETREYYSDHITFLDILFDIFRPFLGLNIFLQDLNFTLTNHLFNYTIYNTDHVSQIMPSVGHGYFFFGLIMAPFFTILMFVIAYFLLKILVKTKRIDIILILLIPIIRITLTPGQNISIIMNDLSSILVLFIPLYLITKVIKI